MHEKDNNPKKIQIKEEITYPPILEKLPPKILERIVTVAALFSILYEDEVFDFPEKFKDKVKLISDTFAKIKLGKKEQKKETEIKFGARGDMGILDYLRQPEIDPRRKVAMIVMGGAQTGVIGATACGMAKDNGLMDKVSMVMGISAGVANIAYVGAGQWEQGIKIYSDNNTRPNHFSRIPQNPAKALAMLGRRVFMGIHGPALVNTNTVGEAMRSEIPLDTRTFIESNKNREMVAVLTDVATGKPVFVDMKCSDIPELVNAAVTMPGLSIDPYKKINVNGTEIDCCDGGIAAPLPIKELIAQGYTDVIVLTNSCLDIKHNIGHRLQEAILWILTANPNFKYPPAFYEMIKGFRHKMVEQFQQVKELISEAGDVKGGCRVLVIGPLNKPPVGMLDTNRERIEAAEAATRKFAHSLFASQN